jgi:O-antigen ligase
VDDYSGRAHIELFGWHPIVLADLCAVTLLSSFLLSKRASLYSQVFLFAINVAAGSRASTALLIAILIAIRLASVRLTPRFIALSCCLGSVLILVFWVGLESNYRFSQLIASEGQTIYGDKLDEDLPSLNGRTDVWDAAAPVVAHSIFLGYGFGGARDVLVNNSSWNWVAGDAHNAFIELILAGGFPATLMFFLGWAGAARRAWRSRGFSHIAALGIFGYIAGFGIVSPNLTNLQALSPFLIITIDTMLCADFALSRVRSPERKRVSFAEELVENPAGT